MNKCGRQNVVTLGGSVGVEGYESASSILGLPGHNHPNEQSHLVQELFSFLANWSAKFDKVDEQGFGKKILPLMLRNSVNSSDTGLVAKAESLLDVARTSGSPLINYSERRLRDRIFDDPTLFGEPAWDILLDVAAAEVDGQKLQISAVCIDAGIPQTTVLRWLGILEEHGLIWREADEGDRRRFYIRLTELGVGKLAQFYGELGEMRKKRKTA